MDRERVVDLERIMQLDDSERARTVEEYRQEKEVLIREYMRLQDVVDTYNEHIYQVTCKIEQINAILQTIAH